MGAAACGKMDVTMLHIIARGGICAETLRFLSILINVMVHTLPMIILSAI
jgi:hypothetical protein